MRKIIYLFSINFVIIVLLVGCIGNIDNSSSSDIQNFSVSTNLASISSGSATGCRILMASGTCNVNITYVASSPMYQGQLALTVNGEGYTSSIANCSPSTATSTSCSFTINNTSGNVSTAQAANISFDGNLIESEPLFVLGGGIPN